MGRVSGAARGRVLAGRLLTACTMAPRSPPHKIERRASVCFQQVSEVSVNGLCAPLPALRVEGDDTAARKPPRLQLARQESDARLPS